MHLPSMRGKEESLIKPAIHIYADVIEMAGKQKNPVADFDSVFKKLVSQNKKALDILSKQ